MTQQELRTEGSRLYSYFAAVPMAFYAKNLYLDVARRWKGFGLVYLLLMMSLMVIPVATRFSLSFFDMVEEGIFKPLEQMPTLYIQKGMVHVDKEMPYVVKNDKQQPVLMIDTRTHDASFPKNTPSLSVFVNQNTIFLRPPMPEGLDAASIKPVSIEIANDANQVINGRDLIDNFPKTSLFFWSSVLIYLMLLGILYGIVVSFLLIFAFLGQPFGNIFFSYAPPFRESCRLMMVAATPMMLVMSLSLAFGIQFPLLGLIWMGLLVTYYCLALIWVKNDKQQVARS